MINEVNNEEFGKESDVLAKKIKFRCPICHAEFVVPRDEANIHIDIRIC